MSETSDFRVFVNLDMRKSRRFGVSPGTFRPSKTINAIASEPAGHFRFQFLRRFNVFFCRRQGDFPMMKVRFGVNSRRWPCTSLDFGRAGDGFRINPRQDAKTGCR